MSHPAWILVLLGAALVIAGLAWLVWPSIPGLGRLPGDLTIRGDNYRIDFPVTTCILLSVLISGFLWLVRRFSR